jgi:hypothetical protein
MLILLDEASGLAVNPNDISTMRIEQGTGPDGVVLLLLIRMKTGEQVTVVGRRGVTVSLLHQALLEAK